MPRKLMILRCLYLPRLRDRRLLQMRRIVTLSIQPRRGPRRMMRARRIQRHEKSNG